MNGTGCPEVPLPLVYNLMALLRLRWTFFTTFRRTLRGFLYNVEVYLIYSPIPLKGHVFIYIWTSILQLRLIDMWGRRQCLSPNYLEASRTAPMGLALCGRALAQQRAQWRFHS